MMKLRKMRTKFFINIGTFKLPVDNTHSDLKLVKITCTVHMKNKIYFRVGTEIVFDLK